MRLLFIVCCLFLASCSSDDGGESVEVCTTELVFGLRVVVTDATSGNPLSGVTVTAREGDTFTEVLAESEAAGVYLGAAERAGAYTIVIELEGFQTVVTETIFVEEDECHVITQSLSFTLEAL